MLTLWKTVDIFRFCKNSLQSDVRSCMSSALHTNHTGEFYSVPFTPLTFLSFSCDETIKKGFFCKAGMWSRDWRVEDAEKSDKTLLEFSFNKFSQDFPTKFQIKFSIKFL